MSGSWGEPGRWTGEVVQALARAVAVATASFAVPAAAAVLAPAADVAAQLVAPAPHLSRTVVGAPASIVRDGALLLTIDADSLRALAPLDDGGPDRLKELTLDGLASEGAGEGDLAAVRPKPGGLPGTRDAVTADRLPEPTTWVMIFFGFFGLAFAVRRRDRTPRARVRFT